MVTLQLDTASLLAEPPATPPQRTLPEGTTIGHVHLHVGDLTAADRFYGGALGLDRTMAVPGNAHFYAAGLYHHHLAGNLWAGSDVTQPPPGTAALRRVTVILPDVAQRDRVAARAADLGFEPVATPDGILLPDPSGNPLLLAV
jgi:catechol 2,3-dioxygenase